MDSTLKSVKNGKSRPRVAYPDPCQAWTQALTARWSLTSKKITGS